MKSLRKEDGFTLVELLIVVVVLGIVAAPIGMAFVVAFRTQTDAGNRLNVSNDAQIASAYFVTDVQTADSVVKGPVWGTDGDGNPIGLDPHNTCLPGFTPLVSMAWTEDTGKTYVNGTGDEFSIDQKLVSYYVATVSGERRLMRRYCEGAISDIQIDPITGDETDNPVFCQPPETCSDTTIARFLDPAWPPATNPVTCNPDVCTLTDTQAPVWVSIPIDGCTLDSSGTACSAGTQFHYELSASRRSIGG